MDTIIAQQAFQLRGSLFTLSALQLFDPDLKAIDKQLRELVYQAPKFFQHAPIVIDLDKLAEYDEEIDFAGIVKTLRKHKLIPVGVRGGTPKQLATAAEKYHLAILSQSKNDGPSLAAQQTKSTTVRIKQAAPQIIKAEGKIITHAVRSGQQEYAKDGDLIVIGPVSPGAELLADGNIHVYGPLRGRALAGINGNETARIFCRKMQAELVSIAGHYILNENMTLDDPERAKQIFWHNDKLTITNL